MHKGVDAAGAAVGRDCAMLLGAHESAAGGCHNVFARAARDGAEAVQLWTRSARQWGSRPIDDATRAAFAEGLSAAETAHGGRFPTAAHASYLINLATANDDIWRRSTALLTEECRRAELLGVAQVIVHPGAAGDAGEAYGVKRVAKALRAVCRALGARARVRLLVEITAGQGTSIGCSFAQLAAILDATGEARLGVCLDTQHMFAAGIDWTTPRGYARTFDAFEAAMGLRRLEAFHLNDSKKPLGSRVDRHAVIGDGLIGLRPFARLVRDPRFAALPGYLETPPLPDGAESYALGLQRLRGLQKRRA